MPTRLLAALALALLAALPAAAQGRAGGVPTAPNLPPQAAEAFAELPPDVQRGILEACGDDRRCIRRRMQRYQREQDQASPAPRQPAGGLVAAPAPGGVAVPFPMPERLAAAFAQLPPDVQAEMVERCDDTLDCYRRAMRRYRAQQGDGQREARGGTVSAVPGAAPASLPNDGGGVPDRPDRPRPVVTPEDLLRPPSTPPPTGWLDPGRCDSVTPDMPDWEVLRCGNAGGSSPAPEPPTTSPDPQNPGTEGQGTVGGTASRGVGFEPGADREFGLRDGVPVPPDLSGPGDNRRGDPRDRMPRQPDLSPIPDDDEDDPVARPVEDGPPTVPGAHFYYDDTDETNISGSGGDDPVLRQPGNGAFLWGIESQERSDAPCAWRFLWHRQNGDTDATQGHFATTMNVCGEPVSWSAAYASTHTHAAIPVVEFPGEDDVRAVKSIEVCLNNDEDRVKGVRLTGAHIRADGTVDADGSLDGVFERSNCNGNWKRERTCPSGMVAVGVRVQVMESHDMIGGTEEGAGGMSLICGDPYTVTD